MSRCRISSRPPRRVFHVWKWPTVYIATLFVFYLYRYYPASSTSGFTYPTATDTNEHPVVPPIADTYSRPATFLLPVLSQQSPSVPFPAQLYVDLRSSVHESQLPPSQRVPFAPTDDLLSCTCEEKDTYQPTAFDNATLLDSRPLRIPRKVDTFVDTVQDRFRKVLVPQWDRVAAIMRPLSDYLAFHVVVDSPAPVVVNPPDGERWKRIATDLRKERAEEVKRRLATELEAERLREEIRHTVRLVRLVRERTIRKERARARASRSGFVEKEGSVLVFGTEGPLLPEWLYLEMLVVYLTTLLVPLFLASAFAPAFDDFEFVSSSDTVPQYLSRATQSDQPKMVDRGTNPCQIDPRYVPLPTSDHDDLEVPESEPERPTMVEQGTNRPVDPQYVPLPTYDYDDLFEPERPTMVDQGTDPRPFDPCDVPIPTGDNDDLPEAESERDQDRDDRPKTVVQVTDPRPVKTQDVPIPTSDYDSLLQDTIGLMSSLSVQSDEELAEVVSRDDCNALVPVKENEQTVYVMSESESDNATSPSSSASDIDCTALVLIMDGQTVPTPEHQPPQLDTIESQDCHAIATTIPASPYTALLPVEREGQTVLLTDSLAAMDVPIATASVTNTSPSCPRPDPSIVIKAPDASRTPAITQQRPVVTPRNRKLQTSRWASAA